jgi:glucose-1-phosphate thymidylyltransferase
MARHGTFDSLIQAAQFIEVIEKRQGLKIGCIEEVAYRNGWIEDADLERMSIQYQKSGYGDYLKSLTGTRALPYSNVLTAA